MAVCEIWDVKGRLDHPIDYAKNPEKTVNPKYTEADLQALGDVMKYATNGEKTEKQFFVTGVNCDPERIIIGGYNDEGVEDPLKITFVYKTGIHSNLNAKDFKPKRKNAAAVHTDAELCSYASVEDNKLCLHSSSDTCRVRGCTTSGRYVRILDFRHFESFFRFDKNGSNRRKKTLSNGVDVSVVLDVVIGNTR